MSFDQTKVKPSTFRIENLVRLSLTLESQTCYRKAFLKELELWQTLRHPNIVQFLGVLKDSDRLIFLTEYLKNVSLFGFNFLFMMCICISTLFSSFSFIYGLDSSLIFGIL